MKNAAFTSEVEKNKALISVGDILYYTDADNCHKYEVVSVNAFGFDAIDVDGNEDSFIFSELQVGWEISEKTKQNHILNQRFQYAA